MSRTAGHYIYAYIDPRNQTVRYIGQGQKRRCHWWKHIKEDGYGACSWIYRLKKQGLQPIIIKVLSGLTQAQVDGWEIGLINLIGRYDQGKGPLLNLVDGGQGVNNPSAETRRKISEAGKGRRHSAEARRRMSEAQKGNTNCKGRSPSAETRRKISEAGKGRRHSAEARRRMSEAQKGKICKRANGASMS